MTDDIERFLAGIEFGRTSAEIFDGQPLWAETALAYAVSEFIDQAEEGRHTPEAEQIMAAITRARIEWEARRDGA